MRSTPPGLLTLALDLGNSSAKAAVFDGDRLLGEPLRFGYEEWEQADALATNHGVRNIVYSSVANVPPQELLDNWTAAGRHVRTLDAIPPLPFPTKYRTTDTLGKDRIAAIAGWLALLRVTATEARAGLIVDAGTCITTDLVDASGLHHGGNISPGIRMRLRAMHDFTARLPLPEPGYPLGGVGLATDDALRHGAELGSVYELEGCYLRLVAEQPSLTLVLTGGDGPWLAERLRVPFVLHPHLVLHGLIALTSNYAHNES